jgi:HD-like signal output (HDOD) protein
VLAWLRRLLGGLAGTAPPPPSPAPPAAGPPAGALGSGSALPGVSIPGPSSPGSPAAQESAACADPFAPFGTALGIEVPREPALDAEQEAAEGELAEKILAHFRANKPPPASFPALSLQILNLVARPDAEVSELAHLIARDPALSAGILSVANSAFYRGAMEIETVRDAITRLGLSEVGRVAGAVSARTLFNPRMRAEQAVFAPRWNILFHHAVTVASGAAWLALRNRRVRSDRAYLGGLLHDVGMSVALRSLAALALDGKLDPRPEEARIERALDRIHSEVGGEAHQAWNLPQYLTVLAVRHHDAEIPAGEEFVDLHAVRLASAVEDLRGPFAARAAREIVQSAGALQLGPFEVRALAAELREAEARTATLFGISP